MIGILVHFVEMWGARKWKEEGSSCKKDTARHLDGGILPAGDKTLG